MPRRSKPKIPADLIQTESDRAAITQGCTFDEAAADRVIYFLETFCCHTKDRWYGKPFRLLGWQRKLVRQLYGWKLANGRRRFRTCYTEIPKKNGKTELVSGLALYHLMADGVNAAEVYPCASTRKQASLLFNDAVMMVQSSPAFRKRLKVKDSFHEKTITYPANRSKLEVMSNDAPSADGKSASFIPFDELHRQRNSALWDVMEFAGAARLEPLTWVITTAGDDLNGICGKQHAYAKKVLSGEIVDISFLAVVYGADPEVDDLEDPKVWARVNPSWGETIDPDDFARQFAKAKADPVQFNNFLRLRLNVWVQPDSRLIEREHWLACARSYAEADLLGRACYGGLDLANVSDIAAFVLVFPWEDAVRLWFRFYLPRSYAAERQKRDGIPYLDWAKRGFIQLTEGDTIDYDFIKEDILKAKGRFKLKKLLCDPFNATQLALQLAAESVPVEYIRQGFVSMNAPCKELLRLVAEGQAHHPGNPAMDWMIGNARAVTDPHENVKISKKHSKDKVDGPVATLNALGGYLLDKPKRKSVYSRMTADELLGQEPEPTA